MPINALLSAARLKINRLFYLEACATGFRRRFIAKTLMRSVMIAIL
jgi:hypothetical protein